MLPALQELAPAVQEAVGRITLDVLVYSERAPERMVFISGRKYVEGQQVDGKLVLEAITQEGAILSYQGQRFILRPKINPYLSATPSVARPPSARTADP